MVVFIVVEGFGHEHGEYKDGRQGIADAYTQIAVGVASGGHVVD